MGTFRVPIYVGNLDRQRFVKLEALVDTGSSHTVLPRTLLNSLKITPLRRIPFELADGRTIEYEIGQAALRLDGAEMVVVVVFGEADATPLLGATTLEVFNLGVDPLGQRLIPVRGRMMSFGLCKS
jgi:clan AA aspartic protease